VVTLFLDRTRTPPRARP